MQGKKIANIDFDALMFDESNTNQNPTSFDTIEEPKIIHK